jgi:hypothetical protein
MSNIPIKDVVLRISLRLTLFAYELLEAHDGTARLAADVAPDARWEVHLGCLLDLQRLGREALALASTGRGS